VWFLAFLFFAFLGFRFSSRPFHEKLFFPSVLLFVGLFLYPHRGYYHFKINRYLHISKKYVKCIRIFFKIPLLMLALFQYKYNFMVVFKGIEIIINILKRFVLVL